MAVPKSKAISRYDLEFLARTYAAREDTGMTQEEFGEKLGGFSQDHYKQYEVRGPLPHHLIAAFLELTGVTYPYLFTGRAAGPSWIERYQQLVERQQKKQKIKKAA